MNEKAKEKRIIKANECGWKSELKQPLKVIHIYGMVKLNLVLYGLIRSYAHLCHLFQMVVFGRRICLHLKFDLRLFSPFLGNLFWHYLL